MLGVLGFGEIICYDRVKLNSAVLNNSSSFWKSDNRNQNYGNDN